MVRGPPRGYFPKPTRIILVVSPRNVLQAEAFFCGYGLEIVMGSRYLGDFVGGKLSQSWWIEDKVEGWRYLVDIMAGVVSTR